MAVALKRYILFRPYLGKAKLRKKLREVVDSLRKCKQTPEKCEQIFEKLKETTASQTHFDSINMG